MTKKLSKTVTAEEAAKILHISKRKCSWMLENGIIPCEDTGKKTRRYTIYRKDVLECSKIMDSIEFPQMFSAVKGNVKKENLTDEQIESYTTYLIKKWEGVNDVLTAKIISDVLGYNIESVRRWLRSGKLQSVIVQGDFVVAKLWLAEFCCHYGYRIVKKSDKHKAIEEEFFV